MNDDEMVPEPPAPPSDDELPPPPTDIVAESKEFPELKVKKPKPLATMRRAFIIFEKDIRTMAKHGLISAVILFIFLAVVFSIMSFSMKQAMQFSFDQGGDGKSEGIPGASGVDPPTANATVTPSRSIVVGTSITLDASTSTDNGRIVYYVWNTTDGARDVDLYGQIIHLTFYAVGSYDVGVTVVDDEWNFGKTSVRIEVAHATGSTDTEDPNIPGAPPFDANIGAPVDLNGSIATDNVGVVNWTWIIEDVRETILYGENQSYSFNYVSSFDHPFSVRLVVRDAAGNTAQQWASVNVLSMGGDTEQPQARADIPQNVQIGDTIQLSSRDSTDNQGISSTTWFVKHNNTMTTFNGDTVSFTANEFGPYEVTLIVRDGSGNYGRTEGTTIATPPGMSFSMISWTSTPFDVDISFNLLTYSYGIALLASVIFVGGLFAKGFTHEITKGTVKVLFFGPISVTTMIFSKILYPLVIAPLFIFPVVFIGLSQFEQSTADVLKITLISYLMAAVTMVSAAYGSALIYIVAKKMVLKPSVISRMFLYFSLLGTLTVFEWLSFVLDQWQKTTSWDALYHDYAWVAVLSPFHQGGMFLSNSLIGTHWALDLWVFIIPAVLIIGGALASSKLYGDIFTRE
ncbi:MAG: PKD domain-containing protein [Candidatus Thermoplasmatota archaeon]|nr:PKD domain-containing protein [Candidatus Thermoplasmatota archaeon]